jgi:hypothetical protein
MTQRRGTTVLLEFDMSSFLRTMTDYPYLEDVIYWHNEHEAFTKILMSFTTTQRPLNYYWAYDTGVNRDYLWPYLDPCANSNYGWQMLNWVFGGVLLNFPERSTCMLENTFRLYDGRATFYGRDERAVLFLVVKNKEGKEIEEHILIPITKADYDAAHPTSGDFTPYGGSNV